MDGDANSKAGKPVGAEMYDFLIILCTFFRVFIEGGVDKFRGVSETLVSRVGSIGSLRLSSIVGQPAKSTVQVVWCCSVVWSYKSNGEFPREVQLAAVNLNWYNLVQVELKLALVKSMES